MKWFLLAAVLLLLRVATGAVVSANANPAFEAAGCNLPGIDPGLAPRLRCGTVRVSRDRAQPDAGSFRLAVVVIKAGSAAAQADPVVFVAGVPLTTEAAALAAHDAGVLAPGRDLVLVDQRGVGRSEPPLCPTLAEDQIAILAAGQDQSALLAAWRQTYATCRLTLADDGIRPEWFSSQVSAEDVEDVRRALGIDRWAVYALSEGTTVAMSLMALHPDSLHAIVLDGVLPPDPLPMTPAQALSRALDLLLAECAGEPACARAYPDLASALGTAERSLDAEPLRLTPAGQALAFNLRGPVFRFAVERLLSSRQGRAVLPSFVDAVRRRNASRVEPILSRILRRYASLPLGAMAAVSCRERQGWREAVSEGPPVGTFVPGQCANWSPPGPSPLVPKDTKVPTLLLSGAVDPVAPPAFAALAGAIMGRAVTVVTLPHVAQGVAFSTSCGEALVTAFLRDPARPVDTGCTSVIATVPFR